MSFGQADFFSHLLTTINTLRNFTALKYFIRGFAYRGFDYVITVLALINSFIYSWSAFLSDLNLRE